MHSDGQDARKAIICKFIQYLNSVSSNYILKGNTALALCYGSTRFSDDFVLDALCGLEEITNIVEQFCTLNEVEYSVDSICNTSKRYCILYNGGTKCLNISVEYYRKRIHAFEYVEIDGILVYTVLCLLSQMLNEYKGNKGQLSALYNILFICTYYKVSLPQFAMSATANALAYDGLKHIDYLLETQGDTYRGKDINKTKLKDMAVMVFTDLGII